ncbi:uncharacterized protein LOC111709516 [Eurytemora carolleeae]|uniref:uncharacterized protein LOC111709516 n=1 Tax=Eurytemora carolleeae TaxID=1294199 RepID=UPI000C77AF55|nr:uncharacterized protein LOC111709516 [Eurytemora carolleeae]|eukprot:XP_023338969.1 uncharacterized protein LOC111709516 [Eurytemora affinis]
MGTHGTHGISANLLLCLVLLVKPPNRRWSQGLLVHQAVVDLIRSAILIPLGKSILECQPVNKCSLVETTFLLLVTVSTIQDSPQCVGFGLFMIWFASVTVNLGPTFLSGALAANNEALVDGPSCPLVQGPYRHYVLNAIWILINVLCVMLTIFHLHKLYQDLNHTSSEAQRVANLFLEEPGVQELDTLSLNQQSIKIKSYITRLEEEGISRVKMFIIIITAYLVFWGPLFLVTLFSWSTEWKAMKNSMAHEVSLHIAFVHAFVNPLLFLSLHQGLRKAVFDIICCGCLYSEDTESRQEHGNSITKHMYRNGYTHQQNGRKETSI